MKSKGTIFLFFLLSFSLLGFSQGRFHIIDGNSVSIPFKLVNNLVVIKAKVNGSELTFLLDSGIDKTLLFNLKVKDSIRMNNVERFELKGLGTGNQIEALISKKNLFRIDNLINPNHLIYLIVSDQFDLSAKMGIDINGIIGGDLFKNFIVKINYNSKKITFYNPETYTYKRCRGCETFPLEFYRQKPFIDVYVKNHLNDLFKVKLLIDSGGGDSLWLFENTHPSIVVSEKHFRDFLGIGLSGSIFGKRSMMNELRIGNFKFEKINVAYPDSISIQSAFKNKKRNGTLGANVLRRFNVIFDYPNKKITLKKNSHYSKPFLYNKSGIEIIYGDEVLVKEVQSSLLQHTSRDNKNSSYAINEIIKSYGLSYKPSYQISFVRHNSPAHLSGILMGDVILEINGRVAHNLKMQEIMNIFSQKENKRIKLLIERNGKQLRYAFYLRDALQKENPK